MEGIKKQIMKRMNIKTIEIYRLELKTNSNGLREIFFEIEDCLHVPGIQNKVYIFVLYTAYLNTKTDTIRKGSICRAGSMLKESELIRA